MMMKALVTLMSSLENEAAGSEENPRAQPPIPPPTNTIYGQPDPTCKFFTQPPFSPQTIFDRPYHALSEGMPTSVNQSRKQRELEKLPSREQGPDKSMKARSGQSQMQASVGMIPSNEESALSLKIEKQLEQQMSIMFSISESVHQKVEAVDTRVTVLSDDVEQMKERLKKLEGIAAQHQNKEIPMTFPPPPNRAGSSTDFPTTFHETRKLWREREASCERRPEHVPAPPAATRRPSRPPRWVDLTDETSAYPSPNWSHAKTHLGGHTAERMGTVAVIPKPPATEENDLNTRYCFRSQTKCSNRVCNRVHMAEINPRDKKELDQYCNMLIWVSLKYHEADTAKGDTQLTRGRLLQTITVENVDRLGSKYGLVVNIADRLRNYEHSARRPRSRNLPRW